MNKRILFFVLPLFLAANGCKKDSGGNDTPSKDGYTVYTNQTGNPNADALQAQHVDNENNAITRFYGNFKSDGTPGQLLSATYQKINNDTTVHMITDPATDRLKILFYEVKGVKQPVVMKFDYVLGNDSAFTLSLYTYDWNSKTSTLRFQSLISGYNGVFNTEPLFGNFKTTNMLWSDMTGILSLNLYLIQYVLTQYLFASALGSQISSLSYLQNIWGYLMLAMLQTHASLHYLSNTKPAPSGASYPSGVPANNPSTASNPASNLSKSPCDNTYITFFASRDNQGKVTIVGVDGGTPPYKYSGNGIATFETQSTLSGTFEKNKKYTFTVKDAKGCMGSISMTF